jgi:hypothetical protein
MNTTITRLYFRHVVPGPFFSDKSIMKSYHLKVSWLDDKGWAKPINPALETFNQYQSTYNGYYFNKSRFQRAISHRVVNRLMKKEGANIVNSKEWKYLQHYLKDRIAPATADSLHIEIYDHSYLKKDSVLLDIKVSNH